jgi:hypothetical protein
MHQPDLGPGFPPGLTVQKSAPANYNARIVQLDGQLNDRERIAAKTFAARLSAAKADAALTANVRQSIAEHGSVLVRSIFD